MDIFNKETAPVVAPVTFTLDEQAAFATLGQNDLVERMTVTDKNGKTALPSVSALTTAICVAEAAPRGATRMLAAWINVALPAVEGSQHWYETVSTDSTDMAKAFEPIRAEVTSTARARNHSNPAQLIKQVKEQGRILRDGKEPEKKDTAPRDAFKRISEDLLALHKWGNTAQQDPIIKAHVERVKIEAGLVHITKALIEMGVDLDAE
tara:strand:- start:108 stop:731 length:624 start_codon:yes stop_codon:yes gene_type:complete